MSDSFNEQVRAKLGAKLKMLIEEKHSGASIRKLDAVTGKDYAWLGKVFRGEQNITIDSLSELLMHFKIQPKDVFEFKVSFPKEEQ